ncbi:MAG: flagellar basal body rod protein FlgC [Gaiellaceae bacterium]
MGMFDAFRISASGMTAERLRMDVVAENLANANTTRGADGGPYQRKDVVLRESQNSSFADVLSGVEVAEIRADSSPPRQVYDPGHPDADARGFVSLPNVNSVTEMVDLITASRGYEANVQAMNAAKQMFSRTLEILR